MFGVIVSLCHFALSAVLYISAFMLDSLRMSTFHGTSRDYYAFIAKVVFSILCIFQFPLFILTAVSKKIGLVFAILDSLGALSFFVSSALFGGIAGFLAAYFDLPFSSFFDARKRRFYVNGPDSESFGIPLGNPGEKIQQEREPLPLASPGDTSNFLPEVESEKDLPIWRLFFEVVFAKIEIILVVLGILFFLWWAVGIGI